MAPVTYNASLNEALGTASAQVTVDEATGYITAATVAYALGYADGATTVALNLTYFDDDGTTSSSSSLYSDGAHTSGSWSLGSPVALTAGRQFSVTFQIGGHVGSSGGPYKVHRTPCVAPSESLWASGQWPAGTIVAAGSFALPGTSQQIAVDVETFTGGYNGAAAPDLLPIYRVLSGTPGTSKQIVMDTKTYQGRWASSWKSTRRADPDDHEFSYSFDRANLTGSLTAGAQRAAAVVGTPSGFGNGRTVVSDGPGTAFVPQLPTDVGFRYSTDPVGTYFLTLPLTTVTPPYGEATLTDELHLEFSIELDAINAASIEVTGGSPGVSTPGGGTDVGVTPTPGGVNVTTPDGTVHYVPLPGGAANGPITIRIDGGTLVVIYGGQVIYLYTLSPADLSALSVPGVYVGIWNGSTVTADPGYPAVYPPLGGWRYNLKATQRVPLSNKHRLWWAWAHREDGLSVLVHDTGAVEFVTGVTREDELDPTVTVYRGGWTHKIPAGVATLIAAAGGLEFLTEVLPPSP